MTKETLPLKLNTALDYADPEVRRVLKSTIAFDATSAEFDMFIAFCQSTGLNPYKKEIWFIKTKGYTKKDGTKTPDRVQIMTGINGFYAIANEHPMYDGMEEVRIERGPKNNIIRAKATVWRKDRRFPSVGVAEWDEYFPGPNQYGKPGIWETKPSMMLSKVAESIALRKAFPQQLNGLHTAEEMPIEYSVEHKTNEGVEIQSPKPLKESKRQKQESINLDTGEVTEIKLDSKLEEDMPDFLKDLPSIDDLAKESEMESLANPNLNYEGRNYRYELDPSLPEDMDSKQIDFLRKNDFVYDIETDCWYSDQFVEKMKNKIVGPKK